jgi:redox-sensitive bicupin YhaK (pirin superfamily)
MEEVRAARLLKGTLMREGAGVKLHRYLGVDRTNEFEPILLFDYFDSSDPMDYMGGFPPHPHRGFETITYLLHGTITHEDNQGHKGVLRAGDVQWMTAGKGIIHSEMPSASSGRLQGLQLWLNLPAANKMDPPRYQERLSSELPVETKESGVVIKVIAGTTDQGTSSPIIDIATRPLFFDIHLPAGESMQQTIPKDYQALLFVIFGEVRVGDHLIHKEHLVALSSGDILTLKAEQPSHCLLIAATKLHEPVARYGPFVMNTEEEVMKALDDFRSGAF